VQVDRAAHVAVQTGVEQPGRIVGTAALIKASRRSPTARFQPGIAAM